MFHPLHLYTSPCMSEAGQHFKSQLNERHTSSISVAEVGKPPDVAQAHRVAHAGEDKLNLVPPVPSPGVFILLHRLTWNCSILQQTDGQHMLKAHSLQSIPCV